MVFEQGVELSLPTSLIPELSGAKARDLDDVFLSPSGEIIVFDALDAHLSTKAVIEAALAVMPQGAFSAKFGAIGGAKSSPAKKISSAENGKKGGRPKKAIAITEPQREFVEVD